MLYLPVVFHMFIFFHEGCLVFSPLLITKSQQVCSLYISKYLRWWWEVFISEWKQFSYYLFNPSYVWIALHEGYVKLVETGQEPFPKGLGATTTSRKSHVAAPRLSQDPARHTHMHCGLVWPQYKSWLCKCNQGKPQHIFIFIEILSVLPNNFQNVAEMILGALIVYEQEVPICPYKYIISFGEIAELV